MTPTCRRIDRTLNGRTAPVDCLINLASGAAGQHPVICIPGAGASCTDFIDLEAALDSRIPLWGVQPPSLDGVTPPFSTVEAAAHAYVAQIAERFPTGPVHLVGHSFGGWVAVEIATALIAAGRPAGCLLLLDADPPDPTRAAARTGDDIAVFKQLIGIFEQAAERPLGIDLDKLGDADEAARLAVLHERLVAIGRMHPRTTPAALRGPARSFAASVQTPYRPRATCAAPSVLVTVDDPRMDHDADLADRERVVADWRSYVPDLTVHPSGGNHMTMLRPPNITGIAQLLASRSR